VSTTWIVVADRSRCSLYRRQRGLALERVRELAHPEGRMAAHEIDADRQGRSVDAVHGPHGFSKRDDAHQHEAKVFAKEIADVLVQGRNARAYDALVLVAEPHFLGLLEGELDTPTRALVRESVHKHLTGASVPEIAKAVPVLLA